MSLTSLRLKRLTAIITFTALVACSSTPGPSRSNVTTPQSATAKVVIIPIRTSQVTIQFDPAASAPVATVTYARQDVPINELLFLNREVIPVVSRITGCSVTADVPDNQLMPDLGVTTIPLEC